MTDKWMENLARLPGYEKPPTHGGFRMDSNENMALDANFQKKILKTAYGRADARIYPTDASERVASALAAYLDLPADMISVGNGSDQILDMLLAGLRMQYKRILVTNPTFSFFLDRCALHGMETVQVPYHDDMTVSMQDIIEASKNADIIYLDSPNNPTGYQIPADDLDHMIESFDGVIILDEAYAEFAGHSACMMPRTHPNVMVVRTLSKSFGMAGLRVGYMVASPALTGMFGRILQYPYPMSAISAEAAILSLENADEVFASWELVRSERARIINELKKYDAFSVFNSDANFVLFDAGGAAHRIYKALAEQNIHVRLLGRIRKAEGCIRVSIGSRPMNSRFLLAIRDLIK